MSLVVLQQSDAVLEVGTLIRALWTKAADDEALLKRLMRGQKVARVKGQVKRTHMGLGDITPAEKAGMSIMGPNKLLTLNAMSKMAVPHPQWTRNLEKACQVV